MPFFAIAHIYAFSHIDYMAEPRNLVGRMPFLYALRDSFGIGDIVSDMLSTIHGMDYTYRSWEPSEDVQHHSYAFKHRSRAGLRYSKYGRHKYWVGDEESPILARHVPAREYCAINQESEDDDLCSVHFCNITTEEDHLYDLSRKLPFGDYRYPCIIES